MPSFHFLVFFFASGASFLVVVVVLYFPICFFIYSLGICLPGIYCDKTSCTLSQWVVALGGLRRDRSVSLLFIFFFLSFDMTIYFLCNTMNQMA